MKPPHLYVMAVHADAIERTEKMAEAMVPLLDEYFAGQQAGGM